MRPINKIMLMPQYIGAANFSLRRIYAGGKPAATIATQPLGRGMTEMCLIYLKEGSDENKIYFFFFCSTMYSYVWLLYTGHC